MVPVLLYCFRRVAAALDHLGVPSASIVAHSYGSLVASRLLDVRRDLVHSLALLDPVVIGMFMPHLLRSFIYRQVVRGEKEKRKNYVLGRGSRKDAVHR